MFASSTGRRVTRRTVVLAILLASVVAGTANAQDNNKTVDAHKALPGTWQVLGRATVDQGGDKDEFKIEGADRFRALRVSAQGGVIHMKDMDVEYDGGGKQDISIRSTIKAGQSSHPLDLDNNGKGIKKVKFNYEADKNRKGQKVVVVLEGQK
jgi:hypothetical protein